MQIINKEKDPKIALLVAISLTFVLTIFFLSVAVNRLGFEVGEVTKEFTEIKATQENFEKNFSEELFNEHLSLMQKQKLQSDLLLLEEEFDKLKQDQETGTLYQVDEVYTLYEDFEKKVARNTDVKVETVDIDIKLAEWGTLLINKELETLTNSITDTNEKLDTSYKDYIATLPPPIPKGGGEGYSYINVTTEKGTTHGVYLIKLPMSQYKVKTVSALESDCKDNCPTKSLAQYVSENNAVAGMNGSYFCPPDYSSCGGKVNSFDYAFYDSNDGRWFNKDAREWFDTGMFTFNGSSVSFHKESSDFGGGGITGAISNYPSLLKNGEVVIRDSIVTSYQKDVRGPRGVIGVGGDNIYLAIVTNATVYDAAYAMKALGVKHALNLDGGGSSAMYINGGYVVGPGRSLPNAIVLVR